MKSDFKLVIFSKSDSTKPYFAYFFYTIAEKIQHFNNTKSLFKKN